MSKTGGGKLGVNAGFPNPATDGVVNGRLDLKSLVVKNPTSTFYMRVGANTWEDLGVIKGDILVIDRSILPKANSLLVVVADGEFAVAHKKQLNSEEVELWGVITFVIKRSNQ